MTDIGQLLLAYDVISAEQYEHAFYAATSYDGCVGYCLVRIGAISSESLCAFAARHFRMERWTRDQLRDIPKETWRLLPADVCTKRRIFAVDRTETAVTVAVTDPSRKDAVEYAGWTTSLQARPVLVSEDDMDWLLATYLGRRATFPALPGNEAGDAATSWDAAIDQAWGVSIEDALSAAVTSWRTLDGDDETGAFGLPPEAPEPELTSAAPEAEPEQRDSWNDGPVAEEAPRDATETFDDLHRRVSTRPPMAKIRTASSMPPLRTQRTRTEGELLMGITAAKDKHRIIGYTLEYLLRFAQRAIFFTVRRDRICGYVAAGDHREVDHVRSFWIPFTRRSTLGRVALSGQLYLGPLTDKPADNVLCAALGKRPTCVLVIPLIIGRRTVGLLYADDVAATKIAWARLARLVDTTTGALTRLLSRRLTAAAGGDAPTP